VNRSKFTKEEASVNDFDSLKHTRWDCKYHVVWIPKYRRKTLYGQLRKELAPILKELTTQKESQIIEGHLKADHIHALISVPPKYAVAQVVGFIKGKSAIWVARTFGRKRSFIGQTFWARGYCVSTVGLDEETIREYIRNQEEQDKRFDQLRIF